MTAQVDWSAMLAWLSECVDTDEWAARGAGGEAWPDSTTEWRTPTVIHARRHDPKRVLAEVAAKRAILADWQRTRDTWAALYERPAAELHRDRMHPDYEYATTEGQRKAWDYADEPPEGEGWERNVDAGIPGEGWERFDYHEESYWRRLLPEDKRDGKEPTPPRHIRQLVTAYRHEAGYRPEWAPEVDHG